MIRFSIRHVKIYISPSAIRSLAKRGLCGVKFGMTVNCDTSTTTILRPRLRNASLAHFCILVNFLHLRATYIRLSATLNFAIQIAYVEKWSTCTEWPGSLGDQNEQMVESRRAITPTQWAAAAITVHLFLEECNKSYEHSRSRIHRHVNCTHLLLRLHYMQRGIARKILSVRLSVRHTRDPWQNEKERSVQIFIPYERIFISLFWEEEWLVGGDPFYLKFWVKVTAWVRNSNNKLR